MNLSAVRDEDAQILYDLLSEREPHQSISHVEMPSFEEHCAFVASRPYFAWYIIHSSERVVGAIYLTEDREIGIGIFKEFKSRGIGTAAVKLLMRIHPGKFYANINPDNFASRSFFQEQFGAKLLQHTYVFGNGQQSAWRCRCFLTSGVHQHRNSTNPASLRCWRSFFSILDFDLGIRCKHQDLRNRGNQGERG